MPLNYKNLLDGKYFLKYSPNSNNSKLCWKINIKVYFLSIYKTYPQLEEGYLPKLNLKRSLIIYNKLVTLVL